MQSTSHITFCCASNEVYCCGSCLGYCVITEHAEVFLAVQLLCVYLQNDGRNNTCTQNGHNNG